MKPPAIDVEQLSNRIRSLIALEPSGGPIVSCYLAWSEQASDLFEQRAALLHALASVGVDALDQAIEAIRRYLATEILADTQGVVVYARGGSQPFLWPMQFQVPVPNHVSANAIPDIYHLIELKDTYDRYVVLIALEHRARILEINLGAITREAWTEHPELRDRVGEEWAHEHYQNHRHDRGRQFLDEKLRLLEKLMSAGGHTHLILAGDDQLTARVRDALPSHLRAKLVDILPLSANDDVISATLASFIDAEQRESRDAVAQLIAGLWRGGLAVAGTQRTIDALS